MASPGFASLVRFGAFEFDLATRELRKHGTRIKVADQSLEILAMLVAEPGEVVSRDAIRARLWPNGTVVEFEHSVNSAIKRLRDALSDSAATPNYIETLPKKGYRFIAPVESDSRLPAIRHYRMLGELARGGMGVVYRALDLRLGRDVAIKLLPPEFASDPQRQARLMREARAASALNHPNIVTVYEVGLLEGGADFIAMELVAGKPLSAIIPPNGMPSAEVVKLATQIADGLAKAHSAGIVHRDLTPGNVMVTDEGLVKLLDFGLAKATDAPMPLNGPAATAHPATAEGAVMGTTGYMSPEQAEGRPVDARSDIFALGVVLYEMLSGRRAFQKDSYASTTAAILTQDPAPLPPTVPPDLDRIILRCLRKVPDQRFQTMVNLRVELEKLKEGSDSRQSTLNAIKEFTARSWRWVVAGAAAVLLVSSAVFWTWVVPQEPSVDLMPVAFTAYPGFETRPAFAPDGNKVAFAWNGPKEDNSDIYIKQIRSTGPPFRLTSRPELETDPAWSPDDQWIAFERHQPDGVAIVLMPPLGGPERIVSVRKLSGGGLSWTPDSKWLVYSDIEAPDKFFSLWAISIESGERRRLTKPRVSGTWSPSVYSMGDLRPSVSPDGRSVAFTRNVGLFIAELWALRLTQDLQPVGEGMQVVDLKYNYVLGVSWTDNNHVVYAAGPLNTITLWRVPVAGRRKAQRLSFVAPGAMSPAVSPKARRLVYGSFLYNENIWRLDTVTGAMKALIASSYASRKAQYSPDGTRIAFESDRSGSSEIWTCDPEGLQCVQLTSFGAADCGSPSWSPDGRWLAFDSRVTGQAEIYLMQADGGKARRMTDDPGADYGPSWSRDGRWIYFVSDRSGAPELWRMPASGGQPARITRSGAEGGTESPDGRYVYYIKSLSGGPLFRSPVTGGDEERVLPAIGSGLTSSGGRYYFLGSDGKTIVSADSATGKRRTLASLTGPPANGLACHPTADTWFGIRWTA